MRAPLTSCDRTILRKAVAFRTIGCKLNQCETAQMQESLRAAGHEIVSWDQAADVRVLNTCTVTAKSDRTCRREIRAAKRLDPGCLVVVTGCYAQVDPGAVAAIPGVDLVLGNPEKLRLAERLDGFRDNHDAGGKAEAVPKTAGSGPRTIVGDPWQAMGFEHEFITHFEGYTRAFLKIQTGCDCSCSYCIIPTARGPARSMPAEQVVEQVRVLERREFREIVLTGIDLGSWGRDLRASADASPAASATSHGAWTSPAVLDLASLLDRLLGAVDAVRFRLSSIEPLRIDERFLATAEAAGDRLAHHFHLPLQSGSNSVLRRMRRPYDAERYAEILAGVVGRFPDAALGADVIVGFPGESDEEFAETLDLVARTPLTYVHVFSYSDRPGTAASAMERKVHPDLINERSRRLRELSAAKNRAFHARHAGQDVSTLVLKDRAEDGRLVALTGNYMEALIEGPDEMMNRFVPVRLEELGEDLRWEARVLAREGDNRL